MKKQLIILLLILTAMLSSCDDLEQTVDAQLPYVEKLIIKGQFGAKGQYGVDNQRISISVTKSLPPLEEISLEKVTIKDADCKVYYKDKVMKLIHQGKSIYVSEDTLTIEDGVEYRLEVKWKDKVATATTTIPRMPELISVEAEPYTKRGRTYYNYTFKFRSKDKGMLGLGDGNSNSTLYRYDRIDKIDTNYNIFFDDIGFNSAITRFAFSFYDLQFYNYHITRYEGESDGGIFNNGGLNVKGNVKGENVFGIWYGYSSFEGSIDDSLGVFKK